MKTKKIVIPSIFVALMVTLFFSFRTETPVKRGNVARKQSAEEKIYTAKTREVTLKMRK